MAMWKLVRCAYRLIHDQRGASVIETALVVPLLAILVMGVSDVAMGFSQKIKVQQAAARAIEMATAGGLSTAALTAMQADAASAAGVTTADVTLDTWLECNGVREPSSTTVCADATAQIGRYVSVSINGKYRPLFAFLAPQRRNADGDIVVTGYSAVRVQ